MEASNTRHGYAPRINTAELRFMLLLLAGGVLLAFAAALLMVPILGLLAPAPALAGVACIAVGANPGRIWPLFVLSLGYVVFAAVLSAEAAHAAAVHHQRAESAAAHGIEPPPNAPEIPFHQAVHWFLAPTIAVAIAAAGRRLGAMRLALLWALLFSLIPLAALLLLFLARSQPLTA